MDREQAEALVLRRHQCRFVGQWELADRLRAELEAGGFVVRDLPAGSFRYPRLVVPGTSTALFRDR